MIKIDNDKLLFHLQGKETSYVMQVLDGGYLAHLYYGKHVNEYNGSNKNSKIIGKGTRKRSV